ncbi:hypothetical protein ABZP36_002969 [Zizania latifolia]
MCRVNAATLYFDNDADIHSANLLAGRHERLPVMPFFGVLANMPKPFASSSLVGGVRAHGVAVANDTGSNDTKATSWLLPELDHGQKDGIVGATDMFYADSDPYLDLDFVSSSEAAVVSDATAGSAALVLVVSKGWEREAWLMWYREKRKRQRFEKTIRYVSRKAYVETQPRIKGRFAKRKPRADADYCLAPMPTIASTALCRPSD